MRILQFIAVTCVAVVCALTPAHAEKRVALVIGNSKYTNVSPLRNPASDARLIAETLRSLGFTLVGGGPQLDLDKARLDQAVQTFGLQMQSADVALFYYAGHGVQLRGTNYLVPVDANVTREADADFQMLNVNLVLQQMDPGDRPGGRLNLLILDACRNNPFGGRGLRETTRGLGVMQAPVGTLISFATQPGNAAADGDSEHSPFTTALANSIRRPGVGLFDVFNEVGVTVTKATGGAQQPWVSSSPITGQFYFGGPPSGPTGAQAVPPPAAEAERKWHDIQNTTSLAALDDYIRQYGDTPIYGPLARARREELVPTTPPPPRRNALEPAPSASNSNDPPPNGGQVAALPPSTTSDDSPPPAVTIAGDWSGMYSYNNNAQRPVNFKFTFSSHGCSGRSSEPNTFGNTSTSQLFANLRCSVSTLSPGETITITKQYDGTGNVSHSVIYTGTVSADLRRIDGTWKIGGQTGGRFTLQR